MREEDLVVGTGKLELMVRQGEGEGSWVSIPSPENRSSLDPALDLEKLSHLENTAGPPSPLDGSIL